MRQTALKADFLRNGWVVFGLLLGICFLMYNNSLHSPFKSDDYKILSDVKLKNIKFLLNSFIYHSQNIDPGEAFSASGLYYRPMAYVIFLLSYMVFGNEPSGYHLLALCLFTSMCFTIYVFIHLLFKDKVLAFITAILFAVHPINVFFVNYISAPIHSVRFICMFLAVIFFLKASEGTHKNYFILMGLLCFAVALMCHETSMVLPVYILFTSIFVSKDNVKGAALKSWPFFLMLLVYLLFRFYCTRMPGAMSSGFGNLNPHVVVLIIAAFSKLMYLYFTKLIFPDFILFSWNVLLMKNFVLIWMGGLLVLCAGWYILLKANAKSMPFFCATWMMLGFLPVMVASMSDPDLGLVIEPQWLTFSSIGFFLLVAWGGLKLYTYANKRVMVIMFALLLMWWGMVTRHNNWIWGDEVRFLDYWQANSNSDGISPHVNDFASGDFYMNKKDYYLAGYYYRRLIKYGKPSDLAVAYNNLGLIDMKQGYFNRAHEEYLLSIKNDLSNFFALNNLAMLYMNQSDYKSAKTLLLRALKFDKYSIEIRFNLALIAEKELNDKEAIGLYTENLNIVPYEEQSLLALIQVYVHLKDIEQVKKYSQLLIDHNRNPATLTELGSILAGFGQFSMASDAFSQSMRIDPQYKEAYLEAGKLLGNSRMYSEAIRVWQMGEEIDPKDMRFKDNISQAMLLKSKL